jgi:hypothetical protein
MVSPAMSWRCWARTAAACWIVAAVLFSPAAVSSDDPDGDDVVALRAAILELVTEISTGLADPD